MEGATGAILAITLAAILATAFVAMERSADRSATDRYAPKPLPAQWQWEPAGVEYETMYSEPATRILTVQQPRQDRAQN
ncbi:MAG: hypothetical protein QF570_13795 [Myxococcota bacterium]|jgi:hypothetical protein|nr:hypothetical protein [Myxococcota bacterium]